MSRGLKVLVSYLLIIAGATIAGFSVACILLPNDAIDYGTAGIAIIISKLTGYNLSLCVMAVMIPFLIAGAFLLGKRFLLRSLVGSTVYMISLQVFETLPFELNVEHFIAVVFGGALLGCGLSMILRSGGCIDGSEILANIIVNQMEKKTGKNISMTGILIGFNVCVYVAVFFLINMQNALMSLLVYVIATGIIDRFTDRFEAIKMVTIITQEPEGMIKAIRKEMNKTCTLMDSVGAIAGKNKTLICYVTYFELAKLKEMIRRDDMKAFITVSSVDEIIT
ncbi:MAG: YitT family protein [Eubacterium sp.]|nr:YitT family protein [Eubacterium sp.]